MTESLVRDSFHFHCSSSTSRFSRQGITVHEASFQARKRSNEDRTARLQTSYGFLVGVFDGHYDTMLAQYASTHLLNEVDRRVSHSLNNPEGIPDCIQSAIMNFDKALIDRIETRMRESVSKPFPEWNADDVWDCLQVNGMKAMGEDDPYPVMRRACVGCTVLLSVVIWGDVLGSSSRPIVPINELHNASNPQEVQRLLREHPNEEDVVSEGRVKGHLQVTRALGDAIFKVPTDLAQALSIMWGRPVPREDVDKWAECGHSPPYISSTPSIQSFLIHKGDTLILASDGLRPALECKGIPSNAVGEATFALAGLCAVPGISLETSLGYSLIPPAQNSNLADIIIQNALFGKNEELMALETANGTATTVRDDISVVVVQF